MPKYSIVIPVCNNYDLTLACINSIKEFSEDYEIIVVDNGSNPAYVGFEKIIRNESNLGFPKAVNQGIKEATGEVIIILNNDTLVSPDWLNNLSVHLKNYDIVGPMCDNISGVQCVQLGDYVDKSAFVARAKSFHEGYVGQNMPYHKLVFFCVAIKREVINKVGLLDEIFTPGNFEDDDYCLRAIQSGFKCGIAQDVLIHHEGSATHKSLNLQRDELLKKNQKIFDEKWGKTRGVVLADLNVRYCANRDFRGYPTLALVIIAKNEEKGLANAILSARGIVDHVCVSVDSSSTDKTLEQANLFADEVKSHNWHDDFAGARNEAHKGITTDYIMFLDGHEYIKEGALIKDYLKTGGDGFLCTVELDNDAVIRNPRIYKNGIQFEGKVHELQAKMKPKAAYSIIVRHDRINGQDKRSAEIRDRQRDDQIDRIMGKQLAENPKNARAAFHLALHYQTKQEWKKALAMQKHFLDLSEIPAERWYVLFNSAFCHMAQRHMIRSMRAAKMCEKTIPKRWENSKLIGLIYFYRRKWYRASEYFVESLEMNQNDEAYKPWGRQTDGTWDLIGECLFHLKKYWEAGEAFRMASENSNDVKFKDLMDRRSKLMTEMARSINHS